MVVEKQNRVIHGNTVLVPQSPKVSPNRKVKEKSLEEKSKQLKKERNHYKLKIALKFVGVITGIFTIGMFMITRYSIIYSTQKQIIEINESISNYEASNEDLKIKLLKFDNIAYIEKVATEKLGMIKPTIGNAAYCNLDSNKKVSEEQKSSGASSKIQSFLEKIKDLLF